ncbi:tyrosine-type recombinase/integrase [Bradyrhizobium sp. AZCC 1708]|uniref:tyrosine-type recombinase/integrase n=1 Tax=Bradyrhizobium sp. AZCC 1708 TaxID=3117015 RepID=UPI002FF319F4
MLLTDAAVRKYKSTKVGREIPDSQSPGLRLLIHPKFLDGDGKSRDGAKSWIIRLRRPDGKTAKLTIGRVFIKDAKEPEPDIEPVLGGVLTLAAARRLAAKIAQDRARGIDVIAAYKSERSRERAKSEDAAANSFGKLAVQFFRDHRVKKWGTRPRRWRGDAAILGLRWDCDDPSAKDPEIIHGGLADRWSDKPLASIDGHDIHTVVDEARRLGIPGLGKRNKHVSDARGRKMHSGLSNFFRWAVRQRKVTSNPAQGVWSPGAPPARERTLNDPEIKKFWLATEQVVQPVRSLLRVLLLTGQRLGEVRGMRRDELSGFIPGTVEGIWTISGARTKNHRPNVLVLPPLVKDLIAEVPVFEGSALVFTGANGESPCWIGSKIKRSLDEAMGEGVPRWTLHDLRRTCASGLLRLGVRAEVVERCLNHVSGSFSGVAGTYMRDPLTEEVAVALLRWSQHVIGLVEGGDKVVPLRAEAK